MPSAFDLLGWLCLSRHVREHIQSAIVMQSVDKRLEGCDRLHQLAQAKIGAT
jgi:hypothetical protein